MTDNVLIYDVIIVGSGPAGVSAAYPLVEAGKRVLMVDAASCLPSATLPDGTFLDNRRKDNAQGRWLLDMQRQEAMPYASPKLKLPRTATALESFLTRNHIQTEGFSAVGALMTGGLSAIWGAGVAAYDDEDLYLWPIECRDLKPSYRRVMERIGVSGDAAHMAEPYRDLLQPPVPMDSKHAGMLRRYQQAPSSHLSLWRAHNAVLTQPRADRSACNASGMCLWGCAQGSIWSAAMELPALGAHACFTYRQGVFVEGLHEEGQLWHVRTTATQDGSSHTFVARQVVLAAGAISTTRIVLSSLKRYCTPVVLRSNPCAAFMLLLPRHVAEDFGNGFAMAQLNFLMRTGQVQAFGNLFGASSVPVTSYLATAGVPYRYGQKLLQALLPMAVLGNCFLSGDEAEHHISLNEAGALTLTGGRNPATSMRLAALGKELSKAFRGLSAWMVPGSFTPAASGADVHYAGTLPMRRQPGPLQTHANGELSGCKGVFIADGACFSSLPYKPLTLTIMANADRIARQMLVH